MLGRIASTVETLTYIKHMPSITEAMYAAFHLIIPHNRLYFSILRAPISSPPAPHFPSI
jgi:hypothetical protein